MDDDAKFICERLRQATDDYTSLGRWGWGLLIAFMTQVLFETAKAKGTLFQSLGCDPGSGDANEAARSFLLIIVISAIAYGWFLRHAHRKVVTARSAVFALRTEIPSRGLAFAVKSAPTDSELRLALALRFAIFGVLLVLWVMLFEPNSSTLKCMVCGVPSFKSPG